MLARLAENDGVDYLSTYDEVEAVSNELADVDRSDYARNPYTVLYATLLAHKLQNHVVSYFQLPTGKGKSWVVILLYVYMSRKAFIDDIRVVTLHKGLVA
jgi:hypothetical protein